MGRLTHHSDDDQYQAEPTDPTIFSGQADTRKSINVWQLKVALGIAIPTTLLGIGLGMQTMASLLAGLTAGVLVSGAILSWRYKRGKD